MRSLRDSATHPSSSHRPSVMRPTYTELISVLACTASDKNGDRDASDTSGRWEYELTPCQKPSVQASGFTIDAIQYMLIGCCHAEEAISSARLSNIG